MKTTKRLHLLEPNIARRYIGGGRGEEVNFVRVPSNIGIRQLQEDVENGAAHFAPLLPLAKEIADREKSGGDDTVQLIILEVDCAEDGRMAAAYLEAVANKAHWERQFGEQNPFQSEETDSCTAADYNGQAEEEEEQGLYREDESGDQGEETPDLSDDDWDEDEDGEDESEDFEDSDYQVSSNRIPILPYYSLGLKDEPQATLELGLGTMRDAALARSKNHMPYWTRLQGGCALIEAPFSPYQDPFSGTPRDTVDFEDYIARFTHCERIYLVAIGMPDRKDFSLDDDVANRYLQTIGMYRLLYVAKEVKLTSTKAQKEAYYESIFLSGLAQKGLTLPARMSAKKALSAIMLFEGDGLCGVISRCVDYVAAQAGSGKTNSDAWRSLETLREITGLNKAAEAKGSLDASPHARQSYRRHFLYRDEVLAYFGRFLDALKLQRIRIGRYHLQEGERIHNTILFLGAPGTGKSESAKYLARMLFEENLIPGQRVTTVSGAQLKAPYLGQTAPRVRELIAKSDILFIDEMYSLMATDGRGEADSYSKEALAELLLGIEENPHKVFILAGYGGSDENEEADYMRSFLEENPGIRSRISMTIPFRSYKKDELVAITHLIAKEQDYELTAEADPILEAYFEKKIKSPNFGNARDARNLVDQMHRQAIRRLAAGRKSLEDADLSGRELSVLTKEDAKKAAKVLLESAERLSGTGSERHYGFA